MKIKADDTQKHISSITKQQSNDYIMDSHK